APTYWTWDQRYGIGPSGEDAIEELGLDLMGNPLGSQILPDAADLEGPLREALQDPSYRVNLGVSQAYRDQSRLVFPFRLDIGITDWLTIGGMAPLVRSRSEITFALDADSLSATDGISPFEADPAAVVGFLDGFRNTLLSVQAEHPSDPAVLEAQEFLDLLTEAYSFSTFFPAAGSGPGAKLQDRLDDFGTAFSALGFSGLPATVPLADGYLDEEGFQEFLGSRHMRAGSLEDWTVPFLLGDIELTASLRLLRRGFEPDSTGALSRLRFQAGGGVLVRLGTGAKEDPARFFDQGAGDGQMDVEANAFGLVEFGSRFGAWGQVRYGVQMEGEVFRRIAGPSEALPDFLRTVPLKWTPGNYFELDLNPRVFLTPDMSFGARYHLWSKGEDSYVLGAINTEVQDPADLPPADVLNLETKQRLQEVGFSATYSSVGPHARGEASMPLLIRATYFRPVGGSGGQTPKGGRFEAGITIFKTFWGGGNSTPESQELPGMVP
ncbi:MAG: hypothetical protein KJN92_06530, partial [Gemmatimonadetes bacterium]|nr:hypothetical protein [Gemmatimonadota bacterium]